MKFHHVVFAALIAATAQAAPYPFDVHDFVMLDRISNPQIAPNGKQIAYQLSATDYAANSHANSIWMLDLDAAYAQAQCLNAPGIHAWQAR